MTTAGPIQPWSCVDVVCVAPRAGRASLPRARHDRVRQPELLAQPRRRPVVVPSAGGLHVQFKIRAIASAHSTTPGTPKAMPWPPPRVAPPSASLVRLCHFRQEVMAGNGLRTRTLRAARPQTAGGNRIAGAEISAGQGPAASADPSPEMRFPRAVERFAEQPVFGRIHRT